MRITKSWLKEAKTVLNATLKQLSRMDASELFVEHKRLFPNRPDGNRPGLEVGLRWELTSYWIEKALPGYIVD